MRHGRAGRVISLSLALAVVSCTRDTAEVQNRAARTDPVAEALQHCRGLGHMEQRDYVRHLARQRKEIEPLLAIGESDLAGSVLACGEVVALMEPKQAVAYCRGLQGHRGKWTHAFQTLFIHPKDLVIDYIKEMAEHPDPSVRCDCYTYAQQVGWPDLLDYARSDESDPTPIGRINQGDDEMTVGQIASKYLRAFEGGTGPKR